MKALAAIMLISMVVFTTGCKNAQNNKVGGETNVNNNVVDVRDNVVDAREFVDLGLPSGTLWATCNVGANAPEEYGDYFAWGETQPKGPDSGPYKYCHDGYIGALTKYCDDESCGYNGFTDNLTVLLPEDDAATANWGNEWCMPTKEQWEELYENTDQRPEIRNEVVGWLFEGKNGTSLFLPAAGYRSDDEELYSGETAGIYWSSSLHTGSSPAAWSFYFDSDYQSGLFDNHIRTGYNSVRAVRSAGQN